MGRRTLMSAAVAAVTLVSVPREAQAICGGSSFATCASVNITKTLLPSGAVQLLISVTNLSGTNGTWGGTTFTQIGLWGLPESATYVAGSLVVTGVNLSQWQLGTNGLSGAGMLKEIRGVDAFNGINGGLAAGQSATYQFNLTGVTLAQINVDNWGIHGQGGYNSCSTKLVSTGGVTNGGAYDPNCAPSVTPEPASVILLATGLMGLGGVGLRSRRRKRD